VCWLGWVGADSVDERSAPRWLGKPRYGAAVRGMYLAGPPPPASASRTCGVELALLSLGVEDAAGIHRPVIRRNTVLPVTKALIVTTAEDNQTCITLKVST
jgi:molecular chaperone DnaK (HSP70)